MNTENVSNEEKGNAMSNPNRYIIACDPYDKLNWWQMLLKKTKLFYRNRPKNYSGIFRWKEDGSVEFVFDKKSTKA